MYKQFFRLKTTPFRITPDTRRFFGGGHRAAILDALRYAIVSGEGIVKVTGEVGTGKTMLCRMLQEALDESVDVAYLANPNLSDKEVIAAILLELGESIEAGSSQLQQQQQLQHFLLQRHHVGRRVVVMVEEAQCMDSTTLEALRLLSNFETGQDKLLQLVLFGQPELDEHLAQNHLRQLRDRITHSLELAPLSTDEVTDYVRFRLHSAGYRGSEMFTRKAYRLLARSSSGLIRRIHILADKALMAAFASQSHQVTTRHLQLAIADADFGKQTSRIYDAWLGIGLAATLATASLLGLHFHFTTNTQPATLHASASTANATISDATLSALLKIQPAAGAPLVSSRLAATKSWLESSTEQFTIQVLLTDNDDLQSLENLFAKDELSPLLEQLYLQKTWVSGRKRWNVLYGEFNDTRSAQQAIRRLPDFLKSQKPYIRSLNSLRTAS